MTWKTFEAELPKAYKPILVEHYHGEVYHIRVDSLPPKEARDRFLDIYGEDGKPHITCDTATRWMYKEAGHEAP